MGFIHTNSHCVPSTMSGSLDEGGLDVSQVVMGQIKKMEPKMYCECMTVSS